MIFKHKSKNEAIWSAGEQLAQTSARKQVRSKVQLVADANDLSNASSKKILLAGNAVFVSMQDVTVEGFDKLTTRIVAPWWRALSDKKAPKMYISVNHAIRERSRTFMRFAFAQDAYIAYGLSKPKEQLILVGGAESGGDTSIDVYVFDKGALLEIAERRLPQQRSSPYFDTLSALLDEIKGRHPGYKVVQCAPLLPPLNDEYDYLDNRIFKKLTYKLLESTQTSVRAYAVALSVIMSGLIGYAGLIDSGWARYTSARADYLLAAADPIVRSRGGVDIGYLDIIKQRQLFMDRARSQVNLSAKASMIVRGLGRIVGLQVVELKMPGDAPSQPQPDTVPSTGSSSRTPDVRLSISVPLQSVSAMAQAQALLGQMALNTGLSLRLAHAGWHEDVAHRYFEVEGFIQ